MKIYNAAKGPFTLRQVWIDAAAFFQISMTTKKKWRKRGVKRTYVNAEEGPALTPLRLHFLRFLSFDDLDDHSLSHLGRANFDVESFSY